MRRLQIVTTLVVALGLLARANQNTPQQPTFRASVDVVVVDVQVVDGDGRPVTTLDRNKFEVTIDGRQRKVVSSDLIQTSIITTPVRSAAPGPVATNNWPTSTPGDHSYIVAIDAGSFEPGEAVPVLAAARGFVDRLPENAPVGVFTLSHFGPRIDPTTNRPLVRRALETVGGQRQATAGQFNLSTSEIIDIMANPGSLAQISSTPISTAGGRGAAQPLPTAGEMDTLQRVQIRECRRTSDLGCLEAIVSEAGALAQNLEERVRLTLNGLTELLDALRQYPGRKTVVLLSTGMAISDRPGGRIDIGTEASLLGEQAARANATIYALHVDNGMTHSYSAEARRARDSLSLARERTLESKLLDEFASTTGGALLSVAVGAGEVALDRVLRETSAYYLLGVEPAGIDRDGKAHRLRVKVNQKGATIRSRQWVLLPRVTTSK
jgi:VWFA-related protein